MESKKKIDEALLPLDTGSSTSISYNAEELVQTLRIELTKLKNMIKVLPGDIYWKTKDGVWLGVNHSGLETLKKMGFANDESDVIGKNDHEIFGKKTAEKYRKNDLEVLKNLHTVTKEEEVYLPNGKTMVQLSSKHPYYDDEGNLLGIVGNTIDITHLKQIEQELNMAKEKAEGANNVKTEFLKNMSHDIRTPLSGIVGFSEILKNESSEPHIKEYADNLIASSHALLNLMQNVLEAARVSSGEIPKLKRKFNLEDVIKEIIALNKAKASEKQLFLNYIFDKNLPHYVISDQIRIHRIILELVSNALNFTENGHVTITVELAKKINRELIIKIQVNDSGIGIPKNKQQDIYLQFKRLIPSYKGLYQGTGLGLYVVKQFVDELGGEIYVRSNEGKGSSFSCLIPVQEALLDDDSGVDEDKGFLNELGMNTANSFLPSPKTDKPNSVLLVEDNVIAQKAAFVILSAMNCNVHIASSGQEALHRINNNQYDLIFMDIGLGAGIDGYEVTQQIRIKENNNSQTPIVALTAHAAEENKELCIKAGMDAVLAKPMTQAHANHIINSFVRNPENPDVVKAQKAKLDLPDNEDELFQLEQYAILEIEQALKSLGDKSVLIDLLKGLVEKDLNNDFLKMKTAFANEDYDNVEKLAHKIKGGAVYVGTIRMKYACQYLERYRKTGKQELFPKLYEQAVSVIEETERYVKEWLKTAS